MGDLLQQGCAWLGGVLKRHAARPVTYGRGENALALAATVGRPDQEVENQYGIRVGVAMTDFLIAAADFPVSLVEPQIGDRIVFAGGVYEALDLAGQGCWRWDDPHETILRIHTKRTGTE